MKNQKTHAIRDTAWRMGAALAVGIIAFFALAGFARWAHPAPVVQVIVVLAVFVLAFILWPVLIFRARRRTPLPDGVPSAEEKGVPFPVLLAMLLLALVLAIETAKIYPPEGKGYH